MKPLTTFSAISFTAALLTTSTQAALIAQYLFENDAADEVASNDGTWNGTAAYSTAVSPFSSTSASFSNANNFTIDKSAIGFSPSTAYSISFWVNTSAAGDSFLTMGDSRGSNTDRDLDIFDNGSGNLIVNSSNAFFLASGVNVTDGANHHITLTYTGGASGTASIYVDGAFANSTAATGTPFDRYTLRAGGGDTINDNFGMNGLMDDLSFYDEALNDTQVLSLYTTGVAVPEPTSTALLGMVACGFILRRRR